mmetsp:Transcript_3979/g.7678  ORF Transcript_3979/g.7678 Transcript_3979/m.7678 type:complete len:463 (-) Transcript_3979:291-1679(-)
MSTGALHHHDWMDSTRFNSVCFFGSLHGLCIERGRPWEFCKRACRRHTECLTRGHDHSWDCWAQLSWARPRGNLVMQMRPTTRSMSMSASDRATQDCSVVICGCGIVGASAAYYLTEQAGVSVTLVDRVGPAAAASGKAGGFLARTWCDGRGYGDFARKSYQLHEELDRELGGGIGYRKLVALAADIQARVGPGQARSLRDLPGWLDNQAVVGMSCIGSENDTAQVHPKLLNNKLVDASISRGARLEIGEVVGLTSGPSGTGYVTQLADGRELHSTHVILALGPWTQRALNWISTDLSYTVTGMKAHSVVVKENLSTSAVTNHAVFSQFLDESGVTSEPEIYPRPDGTVYCCGVSESPSDPPADPNTIEPSPGAVEQLMRFLSVSTAKNILSAVEREQACCLPVTSNGRPVIGELSTHPNLFVATGHTCWGILNGPATGLALTELILKGSCSFFDMSFFRPT